MEGLQIRGKRYDCVGGMNPTEDRIELGIPDEHGIVSVRLRDANGVPEFRTVWVSISELEKLVIRVAKAHRILIGEDT